MKSQTGFSMKRYQEELRAEYAIIESDVQLFCAHQQKHADCLKIAAHDPVVAAQIAKVEGQIRRCEAAGRIVE